ncbi:MarR family winged helix-turn-helix transcriptional regulator [Variovorax sp. EBFNA2]|uniref:MarR family winged helix-turn-helix transcriptional regulator n=1 Tax=Variovorax sp. EBFNA2 TaxID=3342097 RepID=UPI0029C0DBED|nr:MarR family winged helix-turn-helix transcriptional regulator [Variovorax boronicumulans]WPG41524.1 MarR family winged helix-turn-helix transcriptional regulator [Variovorax boronicumulans]
MSEASVPNVKSKAPKVLSPAPTASRKQAALVMGKYLLEDSVGYALRRALVRSDGAFAKYLVPPMSPARLSALATVGVNPGINQSALGAMLNIAGPSVVKVIDDLEGMGVLRRERMDDRRNYALVLTEQGVTELNRYQQLVRTFEAEIAVALTADERKQLLHLLSKIAPTES